MLHLLDNISASVSVINLVMVWFSPGSKFNPSLHLVHLVSSLLFPSLGTSLNLVYCLFDTAIGLFKILLNIYVCAFTEFYFSNVTLI